MITRSTHVTLWRSLRNTFSTALIVLTLAVVGTIAFQWYHGVASLEDTRSRVLLTLIGVVVGALAGAHPRRGLAQLICALDRRIRSDRAVAGVLPDAGVDGVEGAHVAVAARGG
jgi:hypothetical protein